MITTDIEQILNNNLFRYTIKDFNLNSLVLLKNLVTKLDSVDCYLCVPKKAFEEIGSNLNSFHRCLSVREDNKFSIFGIKIVFSPIQTNDLVIYTIDNNEHINSVKFNIGNFAKDQNHISLIMSIESE